VEQSESWYGMENSRAAGLVGRVVGGAVFACALARRTLALVRGLAPVTPIMWERERNIGGNREMVSGEGDMEDR
jgi:hypothetical protein